jgi:hypothetical protein
MVSAETRDWLRWHAGLGGWKGSSSPAISEAAQTGDVDSLNAAWDDLIAALAAMNRELNGDRPSEVTGSGDDDVPRQVAYAISEMVRMLKQPTATDPSFVRVAGRVEIAWNAVLAGDVDDLSEHVTQEETCP